MQQLENFLVKHRFPTDFPHDGKLHRFDRNGENTGWLTIKILEVGGKQVTHAECGDWKGAEKYKFEDESATQLLTPEELAELRLLQKAHEKKLREEVAAENERVAALCEKLWTVAHGPNGHVSEYLTRKKIPGFYGAKTITTDEYREFMAAHGKELKIPSGYVNLLVPSRDIDGKLWGLQRIQPNGTKGFFSGQKTQGLFHLIGEAPAPNGWLYICEGFATAASIHLATGVSVASGFYASNIPLVAKVWREKFPDLRILVCGDDDQHNSQNDGRTKGTQAANETGSLLVFPKFKTLEGKPSDFNDLHCRESLEDVTTQIQDALDNPPELIAISGKMSPDKHQRVADRLMEFYGDKIIKQDRDLFAYTGTHWKLLTMAGHDRIKVQLQTLFGNGATSSQVDSAYALFVRKLDSVPEGVNLFTPPQWAANFRNGTLFVMRASGGKYQKEFRPHSPTDWMINVLPYDYTPNSTAKNAEFEAMLERVFLGDSDKDQKIRALAQMYGACLVPAFPHLFMLHGVPGTGKSTAIIIASRLVHRSNACSVDPTEFDGFNMEGMAGKLINFDTDIEMHKPISEKQIKKIIDRVPFRIRRKGVKDLDAPIPAIHIFGGNDVPKTLDGASRAHDRRWTFIGFNVVVAKGNYDLGYADYCFQAGPEGILNFALRGLADLLDSGGKFAQPESGAAKMEEWQLRTDLVGSFIAEMKRGEIDDETSKFTVSENARIERKRLWGIFTSWLRDGHAIPPRVQRTEFFKRIREMKFVEKRIRGVDYFSGLGVEVGDKPPF